MRNVSFYSKSNAVITVNYGHLACSMNSDDMGCTNKNRFVCTMVSKFNELINVFSIHNDKFKSEAANIAKTNDPAIPNRIDLRVSTKIYAGSFFPIKTCFQTYNFFAKYFADMKKVNN